MTPPSDAELERLARSLTAAETSALASAPSGWFNLPEGHPIEVALRGFSRSYRHQFARRRSIALNDTGTALHSYLERTAAR